MWHPQKPSILRGLLDDVVPSGGTLALHVQVQGRKTELQQRYVVDRKCLIYSDKIKDPHYDMVDNMGFERAHQFSAYIIS